MKNEISFVSIQGKFEFLAESSTVFLKKVGDKNIYQHISCAQIHLSKLKKSDCSILNDHCVLTSDKNYLSGFKELRSDKVIKIEFFNGGKNVNLESLFKNTALSIEDL